MTDDRMETITDRPHVVDVDEHGYHRCRDCGLVGGAPPDLPCSGTITDPALIRATDEPDERGDFPCCTTPAPVSGAGLDLDAVEAEFLRQCGGCDAGLMVGCTCSQRDFRPTMLALVAEVRRLTEERSTVAANLAASLLLAENRAESAEAEVATLRARLAAVEGLAERLEREARNGYAARLRAALATTGEGQ